MGMISKTSMAIESTQCYICGTAQKSENLTFSTPDFWYGVRGNFSLYQCHNCGLYFQFPYPTQDEIESFYPPEYAPYQTAIEDEASSWTRLNRQLGVRKQVRLLETISPAGGEVLDVGCATGILLYGLSQVGWGCTGVELNDEAAQYGRDRFGLNIVTGAVEAADLAADSFDLVMMWNVLEHVPHPLETLNRLNNLAKKGGKLVLNLPDPDSFEARWFKRFWAGWDQPRHLFIYPTDLVKQMLAQTGWTFTKKISYGGRFFVLKLSLFHLLDNQISNKRMRHLLKVIVGSPITKILTWPYFEIVDRLNRGSIMVIVAEKRGVEV